jgi:hypothetical protein
MNSIPGETLLEGLDFSDYIAVGGNQVKWGKFLKNGDVA